MRRVVAIKRKHILALVVVAVVIAGIGIGIAVIKSKVAGLERQFAGITVSEVELAGIADGIYSGSCAMFPVSAEVKVTVKDHVITAIELVSHNHGRGAAAEVIPDRVVEAQTLQVDVISGATYSSKVILKAIENALAGAE